MRFLIAPEAELKQSYFAFVHSTSGGSRAFVFAFVFAGMKLLSNG
jgi:hypothetical protein